jgi:hypothetical protein
VKPLLCLACLAPALVPAGDLQAGRAAVFLAAACERERSHRFDDRCKLCSLRL